MLPFILSAAASKPVRHLLVCCPLPPVRHPRIHHRLHGSNHVHGSMLPIPYACCLLLAASQHHLLPSAAIRNRQCVFRRSGTPAIRQLACSSPCRGCRHAATTLKLCGTTTQRTEVDDPSLRGTMNLLASHSNEEHVPPSDGTTFPFVPVPRSGTKFHGTWNPAWFHVPGFLVPESGLHTTGSLLSLDLYGKGWERLE